MLRILVIGDIAWDILVRPQEPVVWGSDVFGQVDLMPGGSAANIAVWAHRLGAHVTFVCRLGNDPLGELMRIHVRHEGLDARIRTGPPGTTARIGILVSPEGERGFITDHGSLAPFDDLDVPTSLLDGVDVCLFVGYAIFMTGSAGFLGPLLQEARRRHIPVAFDPSSFALVNAYGGTRLLREIAPIDTLIANEREEAALCDGGDAKHLLKSARLVITKRGALGSSAMNDDVQVDVPGESIAVVDTTGAGDAFDAAFLVEFARDRNLQSALAAGNRLGAWVARHVGAQPAAPEWMAGLKPNA